MFFGLSFSFETSITQASLKVFENCDVLEKAGQLSVHGQHDAIVEIKYGKDLFML